MVRRALIITIFGLSIGACGGSDASNPAPPTPSTPQPGAETITLNPSVTYQTITGWEEPVIGTVLDYTPILPFLGPLLDQVVNDLGINKIAIGMSSGDENPSDACQVQYLNRVISEGVYVSTCAYNSVNDNADPFVVNPDGFHFPVLDWQIEKLLLPLKQRVEARGEKLYVQLRYVDFAASSFEHYQNPEEYAELMQVAFEHINAKYGFIPNGLDVMNEPDNVAGWDAAAVGRVIARTGPRLATLGYRPDFVAPSTVNKAMAVPYFNLMAAVPGALPYLKDLSWHCYADTGTDTSAAIAAKASQYSVRTSMSECWSTANTYLTLHQELKTSANASWGLGILNGANGYYDVNAATGVATLRPKAKFIRQYFKYIRAGARRIEAISKNTALDPVAFVNTDGRYVVVVKASASGNFSIGNLPPGTYGTFYTTGPDGLTVSSYDVNAADQTIAAGQPVSASIPGAGVITVYAKTRAANAAPASVDGRQSTSAPADAAVERTVQTVTDAGAWRDGADIVTHDGIRLRLEQIAGTIGEPADLAFTPDARVFVAGRDGQIRVVREGRLVARPALSLLEHDAGEQFLSVAVDPHFSRTHYIYTLSTIGTAPGDRRVRLARFREAWDTLADRAILLDGIAASASAPAASVRYGPDGKLFVAFDDADSPALGDDLASANGKIWRLNPDGTTPDDQKGGSPLFSYAYHSPHGFDWHPTAHTLWVADRDARGASRLDVVATGDAAHKRGLLRAALTLPAGSTASSLAFYGSGTIAALHDNLFVASDEGRHLLRLQLDSSAADTITTTERLLQDMVGGIRVVAVSPDGAIYFGTANALGRLVPERH